MHQSVVTDVTAGYSIFVDVLSVSFLGVLIFIETFWTTYRLSGVRPGPVKHKITRNLRINEKGNRPIIISMDLVKTCQTSNLFPTEFVEH